MKKIFAIIALFLMSGCSTSQTNTASESVSMSHNGIDFTYSRDLGSDSHGDNDKPSEMNMGPSEIEIAPDGSIILRFAQATSVGAFMSLSKINSKLLQWPMIFGAGAILLGIVLALALPGIMLKRAAIGLAVAGGILMILSYFLASQYALILLLLLVVIIVGIMIYWIRRTRILDQANKDNINVIEHIKEVYMSPEEKQKAFDIKTASVPSRQAKSTKKLVKEIRKEEGLK